MAPTIVCLVHHWHCYAVHDCTKLALRKNTQASLTHSQVWVISFQHAPKYSWFKPSLVPLPSPDLCSTQTIWGSPFFFCKPSIQSELVANSATPFGPISFIPWNGHVARTWRCSSVSLWVTMLYYWYVAERLPTMNLFHLLGWEVDCKPHLPRLSRSWLSVGHGQGRERYVYFILCYLLCINLNCLNFNLGKERAALDIHCSH